MKQILINCFTSAKNSDSGSKTKNTQKKHMHHIKTDGWNKYKHQFLSEMITLWHQQYGQRAVFDAQVNLQGKHC